jgi:hypothetical protein
MKCPSCDKVVEQLFLVGDQHLCRDCKDLPPDTFVCEKCHTPFKKYWSDQTGFAAEPQWLLYDGSDKVIGYLCAPCRKAYEAWTKAVQQRN